MTAPRSRASSTSRCCRSASRAHASCSSISPGCTRRSPRRLGETALGAVRRLVGDHVRHNAYFIDFPANVPDTQAFWTRVRGGRAGGPAHGGQHRDPARAARGQPARPAQVRPLPAHLRGAAGGARAADRRGGRPRDRARPRRRRWRRTRTRCTSRWRRARSRSRRGRPRACWRARGGCTSATRSRRRSPSARAAPWSTRVRLEHGLALELDTPVDVLRLACALSDGDVTLREPTRFRSLRRAERRALLAALDAVARTRQARRRQRARASRSSAWGSGCTRTSTRAGRRRRRCSPWPAGSARRARSPAASSSRSAAGDVRGGDRRAGARARDAAARVDRLLRSRRRRSEALVDARARGRARRSPTRVLLSLREHLLNRAGDRRPRACSSTRGPRLGHRRRPRRRCPRTRSPRSPRSWTPSWPARLPRVQRLAGRPGGADARASRSRPRAGRAGSACCRAGRSSRSTANVRFFVYWKQREQVTDYDLSVLLLDDDFVLAGQVSWTNLEELGAVHSGDIVEAPNGATEFIDLDLGAGLGALRRAAGQRLQRRGLRRRRGGVLRLHGARAGAAGAAVRAAHGAREVRPLRHRRASRCPCSSRAATTGAGTPSGCTSGSTGHPQFNRVEGNARSTSLLVRAIAERRYLQVSYLEDLLRPAQEAPAGAGRPVTFLGLERPDELPSGSTAYTPANLPELLNSA